jgi:hypothetical protein
MMSWIRFLADSALLVMALIAGSLVLYLVAPRTRLTPVVHPAACYGCSASAPPAAVAASDAYLARIGAIELESYE